MLELLDTYRVPEDQSRSRRLLRSVHSRFVVSIIFALIWVGLSLWLAQPWIKQLAESVSLPGAIAIVTGIALIPGYLNAHLLSSIILDREPPLPLRSLNFPPATILIAAYNEEEDIGETLAYAQAQDYPGELDIMVLDDGSTDRTCAIVEQAMSTDPRVQLVQAAHGGKARALNEGLPLVTTPVVATLDADTLLAPSSLKRAVARMLVSPRDTVAVAGLILVRDWSTNLITRIQEWDYLLGIGLIKRAQASWQGTLVAQGAFSVFDTRAVKTIVGWPNRIGEDIVMTWALMVRDGRSSHEPTAVAFTKVPQTLYGFFRQRRRWARGMIEGLREHGATLLWKRRLFSHSILSNYVFPYVDFVFTIAFIPGIFLAFTGNFAIAGPITVAILPLNAALVSIMYVKQRNTLRRAGFSPHGSLVGLVFFFLFFPFIGSPISVCGYVMELLRMPKKW